MTWRPMASLIVLRDQVNAYAPNRSRASDGLVGDADHLTRDSDHNPHYVAGVGDGIVSALDLTHDPLHGFDSFRFAEVLRLARDPRIKYVISNKRIFSSYATPLFRAWTWRTYTGSDPHVNHVHVSVLDAVISDTRTPWNLEALMPLTPDDRVAIWTHDLADGPAVDPAYKVLNRAAASAAAAATDAAAALAAVAALEAKVTQAGVDPAALAEALAPLLAQSAQAAAEAAVRKVLGEVDGATPSGS